MENTFIDHFDMLVRAEVTIEDYLYVHGSATSHLASQVEELKTVRKNLETIINTHKTKNEPKNYQKTIVLEAKILMMKLLYIFGEMEKIDEFFNEKEIEVQAVTFNKESNTRMLRMIAEAYAIKGLQLEFFVANEDSARLKAPRSESSPRRYFELSSKVCLSFLKCLDSIGGPGMPGSVTGMSSATSPVGGAPAFSSTNQFAGGGSGGSGATSPVSLQMGNTTAPNVTNFLEYAVHRVPSMLFMEGSIDESVNKLREDLQKSEMRHASELRALLARQLAEILMRFVSESTYHTLSDPRVAGGLSRMATDEGGGLAASGAKNLSGPALGRSLGSQQTAMSQSTNNLTKMRTRTSTYPNMDAAETYVPQSRTEEILLLLLITEALISKELVLDMGTEHAVLRNKKLNEEKFVLDLLTIVLINGQQYNLLAQAVERGMSVAFEDIEMWFKFGLSLISAHKYSRGIIVLQECAKLDSSNYIYHSLIARVALQNTREPLVAIGSLEKALAISEGNDEVSCYEQAKIYLMLAVAYGMKAESSTVTISDKHMAWEAARKYFAKAYELDDMDPSIAYNYALCLAKARKISEACRLIRDYEDFTPAQELNILLLTSMKQYRDALELLNSYLKSNPENLTLLFLKTAIEEKLFGPSRAAKNLNTMATQMTKLGFPSFILNDGQSIVAGSIDRQLSASGVGGATTIGGSTMGATLTAQNTLNSTLGRSQASELFNMRLNASLDGWNDGQAASRSGAAASTSFMDNFTMSEGGLASSIDSPRHSSHQMMPHSLSPEDDVNLNIWILMFEFYVKMRMLKEARSCLQEFNKCIRSESAMYHYHYANGIIAEEEGQLEESKNFYKQALIFNPRAIDARIRLATCLKQDGSLECAEKVLRECIQMNPYDEKSWGLLGKILKEKKDEMGACESLKTACNLERTAPIKCFDSFLNWTV
ncbi:tetratricopeptide repeat protein 7B-like isoform X2 [Convolutriloba macropyga]|uniref:tetratricopeptide repeat protein 7B-like isoform X2 n=1 Tax=Convolutriloba macropyga TaxID=536237 RepID=UPI003F521F18